MFHFLRDQEALQSLKFNYIEQKQRESYKHWIFFIYISTGAHKNTILKRKANVANTEWPYAWPPMPDLFLN